MSAELIDDLCSSEDEETLFGFEGFGPSDFADDFDDTDTCVESSAANT